MYLRCVQGIYLRNIFLIILDWYHKYTLSKCCKTGISQGKQIGGNLSEGIHSKYVCTLTYLKFLVASATA